MRLRYRRPPCVRHAMNPVPIIILHGSQTLLEMIMIARPKVCGRVPLAPTDLAAMATIARPNRTGVRPHPSCNRFCFGMSGTRNYYLLGYRVTDGMVCRGEWHSPVGGIQPPCVGHAISPAPYNGLPGGLQTSPATTVPARLTLPKRGRTAVSPYSSCRNLPDRRCSYVPAA